MNKRALARWVVGGSILVWILAVNIIQASFTTQSSPSEDDSVVAIVKSPTTNPSEAEIDALVRQAVELAGGFDDLIHEGDVVVVKPNIVQTIWTSGSGVVTHRQVTRTVVQMAYEAGASEVYIAEGTADYRDNDGYGRYCTRKAFHDAGYDLDWDMVDDATGAPLYDLNIAGDTLDDPDPNYVTLVTLSNGIIRNQYWVPNILLNCDVLISVPILKNHYNAGVTLSLKNRVGCAPNDLYHYPGHTQMKWSLVHSTDYFPGFGGPYTENEIVARTIVDLNLCRPNDFAVVDGLIGVTNGPVGEDNVVDTVDPPMGLIIAGRDSVAVDAVGTLIMGYNPDYIKTIAFAASAGLGTKDARYIHPVGERVSQVRVDFPAGYGGAVRADFISPTVNDLYPHDGSQVWGTVNISGIGVSDNWAVRRAELYVDGEFRGVDRASPWSISWDTTQDTNGAHTVEFRVYDVALLDASVTRTYFVGNGTTSYTPAEGWSLISIPVFQEDMEAEALLDELAAQNDLDNAIFSFDPQEGYKVYPTDFTNLEVGRGYWIYISNPVQENITGGVNVKEQRITLHQGWNLIGDPFNDAVLLADCSLDNGEIQLSFDEAITAGWVGSDLYYFDQGYKIVRTNGGGDDEYLRPWRGYWIYAHQDGLELILPPPQ